MRIRIRRSSNSLLPAAASLLLLASCSTSWVPREIAAREQQLYGERPSTPAPHKDPILETTAAPTQAQDEPELLAWIRFGLAHNASLRSAFDTWRAAMERIRELVALPDPRLSFTHFVESVETRTGPQEEAFSLSQTFPWFGKLAARGDVQAREGERLWALLRARALKVEEEIRRAYYEYAYLSEAIRITRENLALLKRLEPVAQSKIEAGASQQDLLRLQVEIGKIENDLETLAKFRLPLSSRLRSVMNWRGKEMLPWPKAQQTTSQPQDADAWHKKVLLHNPELEALRQEIAKQKARMHLADLEGYPDINLGLKYIATGEARSSTTPGSGDDPLLFTLSLNLPIYREKYNAAVREAQAARASALGAIRQKQNDLSQELDLQLYKLDDAARQMALYRDSLLPRARQALLVTEEDYRGSVASLTDLIDSQRILLDFEKAFFRSVANYEQALASLKALSGEISP